MTTDNRSRLKEWLSSGEASLHPATFPQRELWAASPVPPTDTCNHICTVTKVSGPVSRNFCEKALAMVVARQEVLRLSILPGKNGPVQLVRKARRPALNLQQVDESSDEEVEALIDELVRKPFDLVAGPLYRFEVIRRSAEEHVLVLVIHHAIADGWTLGVFMTDLWAAYAMLVLAVPGKLETVAQSYTEWGDVDRARWQPREIRARQPFWTEHLAGSQRLFTAPELAPSDPGKRRRWGSEICGETLAKVKKLAASLGGTPFSTMLSAFQLVMAKASGKDDILVGSPVAQRSKRAVWETMGSFAGIVPLRGNVDRRRSFAEQTAATHRMTVDCFAHAMPFSELVNCLNEPVIPGRNPLFDVRFALQNHPVPAVSMPGMEVEYRTRSTGTSRFDLACELTEIGDTMEVVWLFREDMFSLSAIEGMNQHFKNILETICERADAQVEDLVNLRP